MKLHVTGVDVDEYSRIHANVQAHPRTQVQLATYAAKVLQISSPGYHTVEQTYLEPLDEEERYPPLPARRGVNVFGPLSRITFEKATGTLTVGGRSQALPVASQLSLTDISSLIDQNGRELVTLPVPSGENAGYVTRLRGRANVSIDGASQTRFLTRNRGTFGALLTVFTILTGILGIFQFFERRRRRAAR